MEQYDFGAILLTVVAIAAICSAVIEYSHSEKARNELASANRTIAQLQDQVVQAEILATNPIERQAFAFLRARQGYLRRTSWGGYRCAYVDRLGADAAPVWADGPLDVDPLDAVLAAEREAIEAERCGNDAG